MFLKWTNFLQSQLTPAPYVEAVPDFGNPVATLVATAPVPGAPKAIAAPPSGAATPGVIQPNVGGGVKAKGPKKTSFKELQRGEGSSHDQRSGSCKLNAAAVTALVGLRPNITCVLENERTRLQMADYGAGRGVSNLRKRMGEELDKLKFITQKVAEKADRHSRAAKVYKRARDVLVTAKVDEGTTAIKEKTETLKRVTSICENLVESCLENVKLAASRLESWEMKCKSQTERVAKIRSDFIATEALVREKRKEMEASLSHLQSLTNVLDNL